MLFLVNLKPSPYKQVNAAHFINVEKRLKRQVEFLRKLRDEGTIVDGPYAILNVAFHTPCFKVKADSWEQLSRILHDDPMFPYQVAEVSYLADWEEAMAKHADTIGSHSAEEDLMHDVLIDTGLDYASRIAGRKET